MKKTKLSVYFALMAVTVIAMLCGCSSGPVTEQQVIATVQRGDMAVTVRSDGDIEMPRP